MVQGVPPPELRALLPPLLACLPTAFASARPPPILLPLLSPVLRQRVQLLSDGANPTDSWLPLLCWDKEDAAQLPEIVENGQFELHPVSGEVEFRLTEPTRYRRLDEETLQARTELGDLGLEITHLWCVGDTGGGGDGWRVSSLCPLQRGVDVARGKWFDSLSAAEESHLVSKPLSSLAEADGSHGRDQAFGTGESDQLRETEEDENDDDDYWRQYDATPSRTPGPPRSPAPTRRNGGTEDRRPSSEDAYYAQYNEVQPALDHDDPSEAAHVNGSSSLQGDEIGRALREGLARRKEAESQVDAPELSPFLTSSTTVKNKALDDYSFIGQPKPSSSGSSHASSISKLEETAASASQTEMSVKQHIGTSIRNLYKLARATGMDKDDFHELVKTELDLLPMLEQAMDI